MRVKNLTLIHFPVALSQAKADTGQKQFTRELMKDDLVHPNALGHQWMTYCIIPNVRRILSGDDGSLKSPPQVEPQDWDSLQKILSPAQEESEMTIRKGSLGQEGGGVIGDPV